MNKSFFLVIFGLVWLVSSPAVGSQWRDVAPGDALQLPSDLYFRNDYRIQWWYFTGHLYDQTGREFGYELTFFAAGVQKRKYRSQFGVDTIYFSHFAVSDIAEKRFYHFSNADSGAYRFAGAEERKLHIWVGKDSLEGTPERMHIMAQAQDIAMNLALVPGKPVVLQGDAGYSRKSEESPLIASLYLSFTDLLTTGTLSVRNSNFLVNGKSWFDREMSSRGLSENEAGWDWFALQLDNGEEIMLYLIRKKDGKIGSFSSGTFVYKDGTYRHLANADFKVSVRDRQKSKMTGKRYPAKWEVAIPSEKVNLTITPLLEDQEFTPEEAMGNGYWEGTCRIEGSAQGRAYVEMTGY